MYETDYRLPCLWRMFVVCCLCRPCILLCQFNKANIGSVCWVCLFVYCLSWPFLFWSRSCYLCQIIDFFFFLWSSESIYVGEPFFFFFFSSLLNIFGLLETYIKSSIPTMKIVLQIENLCSKISSKFPGWRWFWFSDTGGFWTSAVSHYQRSYWKIHLIPLYSSTWWWCCGWRKNLHGPGAHSPW